MKARAVSYESATNLAEGKVTKTPEQVPVYRVGKTDNPVLKLGAEGLENSRGYFGNPGSPARTFIVDPERIDEAQESFEKLFKSDRAYARHVKLINKILPRLSLSLLTAIPLSFLLQLETMRSIPGLSWLSVLIPVAFFGVMFSHRSLSERFALKGEKFRRMLEKIDAREIPNDFFDEFDSLRSPSPRHMYEALGIFERIASESRRPEREALQKRFAELITREDHYIDSEENK